MPAYGPAPSAFLYRRTQLSDNVLLETKNYDFYYGDLKALENINLKVNKKTVVALIGPSGCGKSTFLRSLNRMNELIDNTRCEGEVLLDGRNIYEPDVDLIDLRTRVGMVFQRPNPFPKSIYDNVAFGPRLHSRKKKTELDEIVELSLKRAGLWNEVKNRLDKQALELSGGQQQRLCIARTLAVEPELILMDEPASALDPASTQRVEDLIHELKQKYTIVIVTHNMQQAARVSERTGFFLVEEDNTAAHLIEFDDTNTIFTNPGDRRTEDYITGRFG